MENNTMEIRHLPEIQAIAEYLRNMTFKRKAFGGVDTEDVLDHFSQVTLQYEAVISAFLAQSKDAARQDADMQARLARAEQENAQWDQYCRSLIQWHEGSIAQMRAHNDRMQRQLTALWGGGNTQGWS